MAHPNIGPTCDENATPVNRAPMGMDELKELALNLHWSWNHIADELWEALDPYLWEVTQNPWVILQTVSRKKAEALLATPKFQDLLSSLLQHKHRFFSADAWFQKQHRDVPLTSVAYFSMEFMLTEALPIYSGGLGNVAGDQMKAASDLGVPVVGVGLLWGQGYFRQDFDADGRQRALYPVNDPGQLPIQPLAGRTASGFAYRFNFRAQRSGFDVGRSASAERSSTCSTPTTSPTPPSTVESLVSFTVATQRCGCNKRSFWALGAGGCYESSVCIPRYAI
jgi:glucan phosphorylase